MFKFILTALDKQLYPVNYEKKISLEGFLLYCFISRIKHGANRRNFHSKNVPVLAHKPYLSSSSSTGINGLRTKLLFLFTKKKPLSNGYPFKTGPGGKA